MIYIIIGIIVLGIITLALIGLREKKRERQFYEGYNKEQLQNFMNIKDAQKKSRQSTPRVPTIKK
jgi:hypothetical protein